MYRNKSQAELDELAIAIEGLQAAIRREGISAGKSTMGVLARAGIDGKLTGGDVLISGLAILLGALSGLLFLIVKLLDGYSWRDASGCAADVFTIVMILVIVRMLIDILSLPALGWALIEGMKEKQEAAEQAVLEPVHPIFINKETSGSHAALILPNDETIEADVLDAFIAAVEGQKGTIWSREEWTNAPDDPDRPGRGVLTQKQWAGLKDLLNKVGLWRSRDRDALRDFGKRARRV